MARRLGCTVKEAQGRLSSREFAEDWGYSILEPDGYAQIKHQIAQLTAVLWNANRGDGKAKKTDDFLLTFGPRRFKSQEQLMGILEQWAGTFNAMEKAGKK